jgi:Domain of unknown function (DUF4258)
MYDKILRQMRKAARAGRVQFTSHALDELSKDDLAPKDAINCILTGEIIKDQYDDRYGDVKYVIYGDTLASEEMALVARWDESRDVVVITIFRLRVTDYD